MADDITKIDRNIAPGENFTHTGSVELNGNVGKGAVLEIKNGGLHVKGTVEDSARLKTRGGASGSINISGGSITITNNVTIINGVVVSNSRTVTGGQNGQGLSGIQIDGQTGNNVTLDTDGSINTQNTGQSLQAKSGGSFHAENVGADADINCGGSLRAEELGDGSQSNSGGSTKIERIGKNCRINAGGSVKAEAAAAGSRLNAGGSLKIEFAHASAKASAGGSVKIKRTSTNDADFPLQGSQSPAPATTPAPPAETKHDVEILNPLQILRRAKKDGFTP